MVIEEGPEIRMQCVLELENLIDTEIALEVVTWSVIYWCIIAEVWALGDRLVSDRYGMPEHIIILRFIMAEGGERERDREAMAVANTQEQVIGMELWEW